MFLPFFNSKIYYVYIDSDKGWNDRGRFLPFQIIQRKRKNKNLFHVFISSVNHLEMEADLKKKQKTLQHFWFVYPALSACQSRKKRGWKARFREGTKSWLLVSKLSPPTRSTFLPFLHPFCIHARRRADKGWGEKKKRKSDRKMEKNKERYKKMQHAWIRVQHGSKQRGCIYIRRFSAGAERETRANGRETSFCQAHPPLNINRVGWVSRVLLLSVRFGVKGEREKGKGVNSEATPLPEKC